MSTSSNYVKYRVVLTQGTQNIVSNYTPVTVKIEAWRTNTGYTTYGTGTCYCTINGTNYTARISSSQKITYNSYTILGTWSVNIPHNADGTKTLSISAYFNITNYVSSSSQNCNFTLTTIPRTSKVSLSKTTFNIGDTIAINSNRLSSAFTHTAKISYGGYSANLCTGMTASWNWNTANYSELYKQIPNATTGIGKITLYTYNGSTLVGSSSVNFTANVINSNPLFDTFTINDTRAETIALTGDKTALIQGERTASCNLSVTSKNYSTIKSMTIANSTTVKTSVPCSFNPVSDTFTATVKDSRNLTNSKSVTIDKYIQYFTPSIKTLSVDRLNTTSDTLKIDLSGTFFNNTFGLVANQVSLKWRYKESETYEFEDNWQDIQLSIQNNEFIFVSERFATGFDFEKSYNIEFVLSDKLHTLTANVTVPYGIPLIDIGKLDVKVKGDIYAGENRDEKVLMGHQCEFLTLENNWTDYIESNYGGAAVFKDGNIVSLRGLIKGGNFSGSLVKISTLPQGFRPDKNCIFEASTSGGRASINIFSNGDINIYVSGATGSPTAYTSLSGIVFRVPSI